MAELANRPFRSIADGKSGAVAVNALLHLLSRDPRVQDVFAQRMAAYLDLPDGDRYLLKVLSGEQVDARWHEVIMSSLKLPYDWLPQLLLNRLVLETGTDGALSLGIEPPAQVDGIDRGRDRSADGHIERNIDWFYRSEIKAPPESKRQLAREYVEAVARKTPNHVRSGDARAVVQDGISLAKRLLATFEPPQPLPK